MNNYSSLIVSLKPSYFIKMKISTGSISNYDINELWFIDYGLLLEKWDWALYAQTTLLNSRYKLAKQFPFDKIGW